MSEIENQPEIGCQLLASFEAIYVDACTWMAPEVGEFLKKAEPILREAGRKLILIPSVRKELDNCAPLKLVAQTALSYIEQYAEIIEQPEGEESVRTADKQFLRLLHSNQYKYKQLLITHDVQLATDVANIRSSSDESGIAVMTLFEDDGELISFAESARRKTAKARMRLAEMVGSSPVYMDRSALLNPNVENFLLNVAEPMSSQDKWVQILRASLDDAEHAEYFNELLENHSELLHVVETDPKMSELDALIGELYLSDANMDADRIILVTDDAVKANELRLRRPKCDRFPFVDFMTVNKYAFLSYLKLSEVQQPTASQPRRLIKPRTQAAYPAAADWGTPDKKPSSFVPQLIGAIKNEDIDAMCDYIEKGANLRNGIITSLCQGKNNCLRVLIERASTIEVSCFSWWVVNFYNFSDPLYLDDDTEHFELLCALIEKCESMEYCKDAMVQLARLVSRPEAAHERLWRVIRLAVNKGAPTAVYSPETGEMLYDIAVRQGNHEMMSLLSES